VDLECFHSGNVAGELIGKEGKKEGRGIDFTADNG
jgi:hypothetical protein